MAYFVEFTSGNESERIAETPDRAAAIATGKANGIQSGGQTRNNFRV